MATRSHTNIPPGHTQIFTSLSYCLYCGYKIKRKARYCSFRTSDQQTFPLLFRVTDRQWLADEAAYTLIRVVASAQPQI
jgi:hypothetical protein